MIRISLIWVIVFFITPHPLKSQNSIPNGNFENWHSYDYEAPANYPTTSGRNTFYTCGSTSSIVRTTDAFHGSYALQLTTLADTGQGHCIGFIANTERAFSPDPSGWRGGFAYNERPTGIRGYYQYNLGAGDSGYLVVNFTRQGNLIGFYEFSLGGVHSTYTPFNFTFNPPLAETPDSVVVAIASNNFTLHLVAAGTMLKIDSISFTGVNTQPAMLDGDFEDWQTISFDIADNWSDQSGKGEDLSKTTDAAVGNYALELRSLFTLESSSNPNNPSSMPGVVANGYFNQACNCFVGGSPFINLVDTLAFYYKYAPAFGDDSASVTLNFIANGRVTQTNSVTIGTIDSYRYVEFPFMMQSIVDSVSITISSSLPSHTSFVYAGTDLKIDAIHFKSQNLDSATTSVNPSVKLFLNPPVKLFPNPMNSICNVEISENYKLENLEFQLSDITGRIVETFYPKHYKFSFDGSMLSAGVYVYKLVSSKEVIQTGKVVVE